MEANKTIRKKRSTPQTTKEDSVDLDFVRQRLAQLRPVFEGIESGDFSKSLQSSDQKGVFTELFDGIGMMQKLLNEQADQIYQLKQQLQAKTTDNSRALEEAQALSHLGSWEWDIATGTITWSDELYRIYGMRPQERPIGFEEFIGLIHPDDRKRVQDTIDTSFQTGRPFEFEHRIVLSAGDERILKGMGKTVVDKAGKPTRMLGTSQDVTQVKQLDRAKDEFISLVSHQLRTPLSIIRIHGGILEDGIAGPLDAKQEGHIRTMTSASIRLIGLVDDILRISRISLNRIKVSASPTDPNKLIQGCIEELVSAAKEKGVTIAFSPDTSLGLVSIDATIFGEILRNLAGNAVRYSKKNNGHIAIDFIKEANGYLLTVKDNGIGIPQVDQAFIFERFYRANNAVVVDSEGNGLGLYIVKLFTEAAGGKIWLKSTAGKGTTFYVSFPFQGMQQG